MRAPRRALVTGGSRGIGQAIAERLAADGFEIVITYRGREAAAADVCAGIRSRGGVAAAEPLDLASAESIDALCSRLDGAGREIDVLVNNAGEIRDRLFAFQTDEDLRHVVEVNLLGTLRLTKLVYRSMLRRRWGRIVNMASDSAISGNAGQTNYSAAKGGIISFTRSLAREVANFGLTVNVLAPGFIETEILSGLSEAKRKTACDTIPLGRFGEPSEVAGVASWLVSDGAGYVTGTVIRVDGGLAS